MPSKLWERIKLSENYTQALAQIDERLIYWPKFLVHKCKQRMTRLTQVAIKSRKAALQDVKMGEKLVGVKPKIKRREVTRERKALAAAKLEKSIEKELIDRLRSGAYGEKPLNVEEGIWKKVLRGLERQGEVERDVDHDEDEDDEDDNEEGIYGEEDGKEREVEYVSGDEELDADELGDIEDWLAGSGISDFEDDGSVSKSQADSSSDEAGDGPSKTKQPATSGQSDEKKRKRLAASHKSRKRMYTLNCS